jgi:hypothetical protein
LSVNASRRGVAVRTKPSGDLFRDREWFIQNEQERRDYVLIGGRGIGVESLTLGARVMRRIEAESNA